MVGEIDEQMNLDMEPLDIKTWKPQGKCNLCGKTYKKGGMTRHLTACLKKPNIYNLPTGEGSSNKTKTFNLVVEGSYDPEYWMQLLTPVDMKLEELDSFLRCIWLECCGHLSEFRIEGQTYALSPIEELDDESMEAKLGEVLSPGTKFCHYYDFGSTTELTLKVISEQEIGKRISSIKILSRNDPPPIPCSCGELATTVCTECMWSEKGWLCNKCAKKHKCDDMYLPVVNSPRVGICGYTGSD
jgi:hypothetical protein